MTPFVIFLGSFLVFMVQPMVGGTLLPAFGGTAAVWTVCLCAFQTLLLAGYFYAHRISGGQTRRAAAGWRWHIALLFLAAAWTCAVACDPARVTEWICGDGSWPVARVLAAVLVLAGGAYVLLSANSSLVQAVASGGRRDVYGLYAVSNAGSLCGLAAYPLLVEPNLGLRSQWAVFGAGVLVYAALLGVLLRHAAGRQPEAECPADGEGCGTGVTAARGSGRTWEWFWLPAASCFLLNAVTAHLINDTTPLPLLWAVLLGLYLASYIAGFTARGARAAKWFQIPVICTAFWAGWALCYGNGGNGLVFAGHLAQGALLILLGGTMLHARLYESRPDGAELTRYYLYIALGGAFGGAVSSVAAPAVFNVVAEYPAAVAVAAGGAVLFGRWRLKPLWVLGPLCALLAYAVLFRVDGSTMLRLRNFYGCSRVAKKVFPVIGGRDYTGRVFEHSGTVHGMQADGMESRWPTLCFGRTAGGMAILNHPKYGTTNHLRVAVAGMGVGTLAVYGRTGDTYRFYELNPQVAQIATNSAYFTFLNECPARVDVVTGDARKALERERAAGEKAWDVLIIDVYSGDAIPPHMATREAFKLYLDRLEPDGILAMHLTNWHLDLSPMVKAAAREFGLHLQGYLCYPDKYSIGTYWAFFTRGRVADYFIKGKHGRVSYDGVKDIPLMTDDRHSLLPYISLDPMPRAVE